jgi:hypothetical protein
MPSWKKVITSGSNAFLAQISASDVPELNNNSNLLSIDPVTGGITQISQSQITVNVDADSDWHITSDNLKVTSSRNVLITGSTLIKGHLMIETDTPGYTDGGTGTNHATAQVDDGLRVGLSNPVPLESSGGGINYGNQSGSHVLMDGHPLKTNARVVASNEPTQNLGRVYVLVGFGPFDKRLTPNGESYETHNIQDYLATGQSQTPILSGLVGNNADAINGTVVAGQLSIGGVYVSNANGLYSVYANNFITVPGSPGVIMGGGNLSFYASESMVYDSLGSGSLISPASSASAKFTLASDSSSLVLQVGREDLKDVMFISRSGDNPRIGVGTNTPIRAFDFKEVRDDDRGGELLIRGSRTTKGAEPNDEVGRINFAIDSASFEEIDTSGSAAEIVALVDEVDSTGIEGHMSFRIATTKTSAPTEILKISQSTSVLNTPLDLNGALSVDLSDINASTINRYNNTGSRIELAQNHLEFYGNAYGLKISNTGIDANPGGLANMDFKVRSDNDEKAIFVDSGLDSIQLGSNTNTHITASGNISSSATSTASFGSLKIDGASVDFSGLPTSDPGIAGRLYNSSSFIKISAG